MGQLIDAYRRYRNPPLDDARAALTMEVLWFTYEQGRVWRHRSPP
jgi:hypothetical protein